MRTAPIDMTRLNLLATGKVIQKVDYNDANKRQMVDPETGLFLWVIDAIIDDDDARRMETIGVTVPAAEEPVTEKFKPVEGLKDVTARFYVDGAGRLGTSLVAAGYEARKPFSGGKPAHENKGGDQAA